MIKLFDIENGSPVPSVHCHTIDWLRDIMTAFPDSYLKVYEYIFYMCCPDEQLNPFVNVAEEDKIEEIRRGINATDFMPEDSKIELAIEYARKLYGTPNTEVYLAAKGMLEKLKKSFQNEELTWGGKDATGPALTVAMEKLPKLMKTYAECKAVLDEEIKARARGGQYMSDDLNEDED